MVGRKMVPPLSRTLSEGGGWRWLGVGKRRSSVSLFEGIRVVGRPLRLAIRARVGDRGGWKDSGGGRKHHLSHETRGGGSCWAK